MIRDLIAELPNRFYTDVAATALIRQLRENDVVSESAGLGPRGGSGRKAISATIRKSYKEGANFVAALNATSVSLADLYRDNRRRADQTLYAGLLAAFACVGVVLWVIVNVVVSKRDADLIEYASSVVPGLLSAAFFYLHRFQQVRLDGIQNDLRILNITRVLSGLAEQIGNDELRNKVFNSAMDMIAHSGKSNYAPMA